MMPLLLLSSIKALNLTSPRMKSALELILIMVLRPFGAQYEHCT